MQPAIITDKETQGNRRWFMTRLRGDKGGVAPYQNQTFSYEMDYTLFNLRNRNYVIHFYKQFVSSGVREVASPVPMCAK